MDYDEKKYPFTKKDKRKNILKISENCPSLDFPRYHQVAVNSTIQSCAAECTAHTAEVSAPGCCEFHMQDGTCHWGRANMVLKTEMAHENEIRAALCYKGNINIKVIMLVFLVSLIVHI